MTKTLYVPHLATHILLVDPKVDKRTSRMNRSRRQMGPDSTVVGTSDWAMFSGQLEVAVAHSHEPALMGTQQPRTTWKVPPIESALLTRHTRPHSTHQLDSRRESNIVAADAPPSLAISSLPTLADGDGCRRVSEDAQTLDAHLVSERSEVGAQPATYHLTAGQAHHRLLRETAPPAH